MTDSTLTPQQKTDLIRLAVAMRAGAALRPQTIGALFRKQSVNIDNYQKMQICSCALGAAWEGSHPKFDAERWLANVEQSNVKIVGMSALQIFFGHPDRMVYPDPFTRAPSFVDSIIIDMNDRKDYTREMIADWLLKIAK